MSHPATEPLGLGQLAAGTLGACGVVAVVSVVAPSARWPAGVAAAAVVLVETLRAPREAAIAPAPPTAAPPPPPPPPPHADVAAESVAPEEALPSRPAPVELWDYLQLCGDPYAEAQCPACGSTRDARQPCPTCGTSANPPTDRAPDVIIDPRLVAPPRDL